MIAAWMVYAVVVSALLAGAALAMEGLLRLRRAPLRWVWAGALVLGAAWPALGPLRLPWAPKSGGGAMAEGAPLLSLEPLTVTVGSGSVLHALDPLLLGLWGLLTLAVAAVGVRALIRLSRSEEGWERARIRQTPVLLARNTGPAALGLLEPRIVLPRWLLEEGEEERLELAVLHEREHLRARDPALLAAGFLVVAAVPWNPVLWWAYRRLRRAVETDCDRRVLRRRPGRLRAYAETLLHVSGRSSGLHGAPAALAEPRTFLERRIRTMTSSRPEHPTPRGVALGVLAVAALAGACLAPEPGAEDRDASPVEVQESETAPDLRKADEIADEPVFTPFTRAPDIRNRRELQQALEDEYPPRLEEAGVGGRVLVWFLVDRNGDVRELKLRESSGHEALDRAALRVARVFDFTPALDGDERVPVWIALPITFVAE